MGRKTAKLRTVVTLERRNMWLAQVVNGRDEVLLEQSYWRKETAEKEAPALLKYYIRNRRQLALPAAWARAAVRN